MAEYLSADQVREKLREEISKRPSIAAWARDHDQHPQFISDMLSGRKPISKNIARALGLKKVDCWEVDRRVNQP